MTTRLFVHRLLMVTLVGLMVMGSLFPLASCGGISKEDKETIEKLKKDNEELKKKLEQYEKDQKTLIDRLKAACDDIDGTKKEVNDMKTLSKDQKDQLIQLLLKSCR